MAEGESERRVEAEIEKLRRELVEMRSELRAIGSTVDQLARTFRALALQLGIAAEPYRGTAGAAPERDLRGFG